MGDRHGALAGALPLAERNAAGEDHAVVRFPPALYHFTQSGAFQPYLGGGLAAVFSFAKSDAFDTGVDVHPTAGLILQGGADVTI